MTTALTLVALWTLGAAVIAMALRKILHSVLVLTLAWIGIAAFYLLLGVEFAAFAQVLVYLGAISMAVLFAVLLTRRTRDDEPSAPRRGAAGAVAAALGVAAVILYAVAKAPLPAGARPAPAISVKEIGLELMGPQAAALLVAAVLLTAALVGAVVLASDGSDGREDDGS